MNQRKLKALERGLRELESEFTEGGKKAPTWITEAKQCVFMLRDIRKHLWDMRRGRGIE